jgi:hypothetical protein
VFVGPQTRASIARHRALLGGVVPLELYPDTAHAMHAQLPVQAWHPAFALTQGREPVNPRPRAMAAAFADQAPGTRGFIAYSEGVNDDWNLAQWLALAWNPRARPAPSRWPMPAASSATIACHPARRIGAGLAGRSGAQPGDCPHAGRQPRAASGGLGRLADRSLSLSRGL